MSYRNFTKQSYLEEAMTFNKQKFLQDFPFMSNLTDSIHQVLWMGWIGGRTNLYNFKGDSSKTYWVVKNGDAENQNFGEIPKVADDTTHIIEFTEGNREGTKKACFLVYSRYLE